MFSKKQPQDSDNRLDDLDLAEGSGYEVSVSGADASSENQLQPLSRPTKPSIISEGFEFVGTITCEGTLNISGVVKGKVSAKSILVDVEGLVEGELSSETLVVKGKIIGEVTCQELNIGPRAYIDGSISYQHIHIQRGGKIAGKFSKS